MQLALFMLFLLAAWLMALTASRQSHFERRYRNDRAFTGVRYETRWFQAAYEHGFCCFAGADQAALFLMKDPRYSSARIALLGRRHRTHRLDLRIPWSDIACRAGRSLTGRIVWFHVPTQKTSFYMRADIGLQLLADAGRQLALDPGCAKGAGSSA